MSFFRRHRSTTSAVDDVRSDLVDQLLHETVEERERILARAVRTGEVHAVEANEIVRTVARFEMAVDGKSTKARVAA